MFQINLNDLVRDSVQSGDIPLGVMVMNIFLAFIVCSFIFFIYRKTYDGVLYSKKFNLTLIMVGVVTSMAVMVINGNLALSLGMVGALSIVRFRSAIKDPKDIAYLFWAITTGIITGIAAYKLAIVSALILGAIVLLFSIRTTVLQPYLLVLEVSEYSKQQINKILKKFTSKQILRSTQFIEDRKEIVIELRLKAKTESIDMVEALKAVKGVKQVRLISYEGNMDIH